MLDFYILLSMTMKTSKLNHSQKKGILMMCIWFLFFLICGIWFLIYRNLPDEGIVSFGVVCLVIGILQYFVLAKRDHTSDELTRKVWMKAVYWTFNVFLMVGLVVYLIDNVWFQVEMSLNLWLRIFIFGSIVLTLIFQQYLLRHADRFEF